MVLTNIKRAISVMFFFQGALLLAQNQKGLIDAPGAKLLKEMHARYFQGPCKCYTFSQRNAHYRNDSIVRRSEWHEAVEFPDKFRISFGDKNERNFVLYKQDSVFNFKNGQLVKKRADTNSLLLLLGGMYYREPEDVLNRVKGAGFDLEVLFEQEWQGEPVYVIGARRNDLHSNQLWIGKAGLRVLRIIEKVNETDLMDMRFETHQQWCRGFVETKVSFRRNGKLEQVEEYYNIRSCDVFPSD